MNTEEATSLAEDVDRLYRDLIMFLMKTSKETGIDIEHGTIAMTNLVIDWLLAGGMEKHTIQMWLDMALELRIEYRKRIIEQRESEQEDCEEVSEEDILEEIDPEELLGLN